MLEALGFGLKEALNRTAGCNRRAHARLAERSGASGPRERPRGVRGEAPSTERRSNAASRDALPENLVVANTEQVLQTAEKQLAVDNGG